MNTVIKIFLVNKSDFLFSSKMTQLLRIETAQQSILFLCKVQCSNNLIGQPSQRTFLGLVTFLFYFSGKGLNIYLIYNFYLLHRSILKPSVSLSLLQVCRLEHHLYSFMAQFVTIGMTLDSSVSRGRGENCSRGGCEGNFAMGEYCPPHSQLRAGL